ncbi:MAG: GNAT family N-acetyltransferase [Thermoleophilaceae bacterium]|nr:GNAT family N-acetyltransferase [Thermoleophilaceae bacterium]
MDQANDQSHSPSGPPHLRDDWDEVVASFDTGSIYHSTGWLNFLRDTQNAEIITEAFELDGVRCYHVAARIRKGPFGILGSPLPGWATATMGPLFNLAEVDQSKLIDELEAFGKRHRVSMYELVNGELNPELMRSKGWAEEPDGTFIVDLPATHDELWDHIRSTCRNRIRKARNNGLTVQIGNDDKLVGDVWDRVDAVFRHQDLVSSYDRARVQALYDELAPRGQVIGLRVLAPDGHIAACGIFPYDSECIYFWAGAARPEDRALVPNELMHWELMCHAIDLGLTRYDMCGGGDYKKKYGARHVQTAHWIRYYNGFAKLGRSTMARLVRTKRNVAGRIRNLGKTPPTG